MNDEEKYLEIRDKLRSLETVKASSDFTNKLHLKIVEEEASRRNEHIKKYDDVKGGFLRNLFNNRQYPWLIPSVGFAMVIFFVFYVTYFNRDKMDNNELKTSADTKQETVGNNDDDGTNKKPEDEKIQTEITGKETDDKELKEKKITGSQTENKEKVKIQKPDLAFVETEKPNISPTGTDKKNDNLKRTIPEIKTEKDSEILTEQSTVETTELSTGKEMAMPKKGNQPDSENGIVERKAQTMTANEGGGTDLTLKLDIINKAGLESIRNKLVK